MCIAYPGQVLEIADGAALVETDQRQRRASLLLVPETAVGDWVVVSAGTVLRVLDPDEAAEIRALLDEATRAEVAMRGTTAPDGG
jgi:hydrogenase expression/formation protein HypC